MILLSKGSLTQTGRFAPETMALNLSERGSTATITFGIGTANLAIGDWLQDDTDPGAGIVWRVRTIDTQYNTRTVTVQLEDMVNSLNDQLLNGEIKPSDIAGGSATTCTARQAVEYILNRQSVWELDDFDYDTVSNPYNFNGDSLKAALDTVSASLEEPVWSYDFTTYPFKISITHLSDEIDSEMRMNRNISTLKVSIDRTRMYTRFYPIGKNNLRLDAPGYAEKNVSIYGLIEKTETDETKDTKAKLAAWAQEMLDRHAEPVVTATVTGLDLSAATGVSLDSFTIGKKCRMPLPEFNTTITEKVIKLSWRDKLAEPENVTVTMANQKEDIASIINRINSSGGRSGRAKAKDDEEDHAWFEDTTTHVSMIAEACAGEGAAQDWSRVAALVVDGNGIHQRVQQTQADVVTAFSLIEQTESEIRSEVHSTASDIYSSIVQTASQIRSEVSMSESAIYTSITQTASGIRTEIVNSESGLYAYIDATASQFQQIYISRTNRVWIQDTDPRNGGNTPRVGDIWVESTHQGTWDGAEGFDWIHDEDYDWTQVQGAKIWGWQNDKWELISDQQQVVTMTDVEQTSEHIVQRAVRAMVNDEGNLSVYRAELLVEGDRIRSEVNEKVEDLGSSIEQTASSIRSEVHAAQSELYTFILQTASQITIRVGESNMVFTGMTEPEGTEEHPLVEGDLWLKSTFQRTWSDMEELDAWIDDEDFDWSDLKGSKIYVYDADLGEFKEVLDEQVLAQDTDIEETSEKISLVARSVKQVDGKVDAYRGEFLVKADKISSTLNQRVAGLGSSITQTASEIRSEVHAAQSTIYSSITQTASQIRSEVVSTASSLSSSITQTASQIRSEVNAAKSTIYSSITQTASMIRSEVASTSSSLSSSITQTAMQIRAEVTNVQQGLASNIVQTATEIRSEVSSAVSGLSSSITQNADKIAIVVDDSNNLKTASIVAGINAQTGSYVTISADKINLSGYVTASQLNTQKARIDNLVSGDSLFTLMRATRASLGNSNSTGVSIYGQTVRVYSVVDAYGTTRQVFGYTLS